MSPQENSSGFHLLLLRILLTMHCYYYSTSIYNQLIVRLKPVKDGSTMSLNNIFFDTNSAALKPESKTELNKLVSFIKSNAIVKLEIGGHTDNVGDDKANMILSDKRAKSVCDYLITSGIEASRLVSKGYGETKPVAENTTEEGKAKNRRTEITILSVH